MPWSPALERTHAWAVGDAYAWGETALDVPAGLASVIARVRSRLEPVELPSQVIHGDLGNNILFADGLPPAVIDISPFWRPKRYADAIVIADSVGWFGAGAEAVAPMADPIGHQLLLRAVLFRLGSALVLLADDLARMEGEVAAYERIATALGL